MLHIITPATTANMGSGFDSIGIALSLYNHVWIEEIDSGLEIITKQNKKLFPTDKNNLIYKTISYFYNINDIKVPGLRIIQEDHIPITKGLGSSAACIVCGLIAANELSGMKLSKEELIQMAARIEKHPDNSNPAFLGGMVVGAMTGEKTAYSRITLPDDINFCVLVPDFIMATEKARNILPYSVARNDAIFNVSRAALLVASMITKNYDNLKTAMDDKLHQPFRLQFFPEMKYIFSRALVFGAKGACLSGSGPSIIAVVTDKDLETFEYRMSEYLRMINHKWSILTLKPDYYGARLIHE